MLWKLRLILYGGAAVIASLVLIGGGDEGPVFLEGRTSQDRLFRMELEDGRPTNVGTSVDLSCDDGAPWFARWWSFDGKTARFRFDDGRLVVREKRTRDYDGNWVGERHSTLEARIADGRVTGTMRVVEDFAAGAQTYGCESPEVTFSAR